MNEFLKMDIFFFVTTITVSLLGALLIFILWRIARILEHIEYFFEQISLESDNVRADFAYVRANVRKGKGILQSLFSFFGKRVRGVVKKI